MIKTINTGTTELLCILIPKDKGHIIEQYPGGYFFLHYGSPKMDHSGTVYLAYKDRGATHYLLKVGIQSDFPHDFDSLGIAHGLSEEVWQEIVDGILCENGEIIWRMYPDKWGYDTATESGLSILMANGIYLENPHEKPCIERLKSEYDNKFDRIRRYNHELKIYSHAQQNVGKWVILKKLI